jgi:hypothetical protein
MKQSNSPVTPSKGKGKMIASGSFEEVPQGSPDYEKKVEDVCDWVMANKHDENITREDVEEKLVGLEVYRQKRVNSLSGDFKSYQYNFKTKVEYNHKTSFRSIVKLGEAIFNIDTTERGRGRGTKRPAADDDEEEEDRMIHYRPKKKRDVDDAEIEALMRSNGGEKKLCFNMQEKMCFNLQEERSDVCLNMSRGSSNGEKNGHGLGGSSSSKGEKKLLCFNMQEELGHGLGGSSSSDLGMMKSRSSGSSKSDLDVKKSRGSDLDMESDDELVRPPPPPPLSDSPLVTAEKLAMRGLRAVCDVFG